MSLTAGLGVLVLIAQTGTQVWTVGEGPKFDFPTISEAIDAAGNFDEILVAPGTYFETVNAGGKRLYIHSSHGPEQTTIDGEWTRRGIVAVKGEFAETTFEGFTVTRCTSPAWEGGGGLYIRGASPRIVDCAFMKNQTESWGPYYTEGGGGGLVSVGSPEFVNCEFSFNWAGGWGGGLRCEDYSIVTLTNCTFQSNQSEKGGGLQVAESTTVTAVDCTFANNAAGYAGGGLHVGDNCVVGLSNPTFTANWAGSDGGAVHCLTSTMSITGGMMELNVAELRGGGVFSRLSGVTIMAAELRDNWAIGGPAVHVTPDGQGIGDYDMEIGSSFFCGSTEPIDGPWIDLGDNTFFDSCSDGACCSNGICVIIDGETCARVGGEFKGVGVYCEHADCPSECSADINRDGFVGTDDILMIIDQWGPCP